VAPSGAGTNKFLNLAENFRGTLAPVSQISLSNEICGSHLPDLDDFGIQLMKQLIFFI
jgi:hypothetical protein